MNNIIRNFARYLDNHNLRYEFVPQDNNILRIQEKLQKSSVIVTVLVAADEDDEEGNRITIALYGLGQVNDYSYELYSKINELNSQYRWFRFYISGEGLIVMSSEFYACEQSNDHLIKMVVNALNIADECYPQIMRSLWG